MTAIVVHPDRLTIPLSMARALLAFASTDPTRPHLAAIGIDGAYLAATDGSRLVAFEAGAPLPYQSRYWPRAHVAMLIKVASARKEGTIDLCADQIAPASGPFPPIRQVMPADGMDSHDGSIGLNPKYFADLALVSRACDAVGVTLTALRGPLDPIAFRAGSLEAGCAARAVIMPMRL